MAIDVIGGSPKKRRIVLQVADSAVAHAAKQRSHLTSLVVVIDRESVTTLPRLVAAADGAASSLLLKQLEVPIVRYAVTTLDSALPVFFEDLGSVFFVVLLPSLTVSRVILARLCVSRFPIAGVRFPVALLA